MGIPCCKEPAVLFLPRRVSLLAFFVGIGNNAGTLGRYCGATLIPSMAPVRYLKGSELLSSQDHPTAGQPESQS